MTALEWTPRRIAIARALWADGLSASDIGEILGVSRNAVIGKARREGFPEKPEAEVLRRLSEKVRRRPKVANREPQEPTRPKSIARLRYLRSLPPEVRLAWGEKVREARRDAAARRNAA